MKYASVSAFVTRAVESIRDFEPLDLLIASMIAETGPPDEAAQAWVERAMAAARGARLADGGPNAIRSSSLMRGRQPAAPGAELGRVLTGRGALVYITGPPGVCGS